jgi:hypothetical protein
VSETWKLRLFPLVAVVALALSACSGDDDTSTRPTNQATAADDCGGKGMTVTQHLARAEVTNVEVIGQCTTVSIETTLADSDSSAAKQICDSAAELVYTGDTNSIRVESNSGKEIAMGIASAKCLATPYGLLV